MSNVTIITGLPRSRTAWLSAFFDVEHEPIRSRTHGDSLREYGDKNGIIIDTGAPFFEGLIKSIWPMAKWIYINRNENEVRNGLRNVFNLTTVNEEKLIRILQSAINCCKQHSPGLQVWFNDLDNRNTMRMIWDISKPGIKWDDDRFDRYVKLHIEAKEFCPKFLNRISTINQ
jgi:hypothetical protein